MQIIFELAFNRMILKFCEYLFTLIQQPFSVIDELIPKRLTNLTPMTHTRYATTLQVRVICGKVYET